MSQALAGSSPRRPPFRVEHAVMAGAVLALIVLIVLPVVSLVIGSVTGEEGVSVANFVRAIQRRLYYVALLNSLILGAWTALFSVLMSVLVS